MRVVLDTNVLVSAVLFSGVSARLVPLWEKGALRPLLSREILEEYARVLAYPKFRLDPQEIRDVPDVELLPFIQVVKPAVRLKVVSAGPDDDKFLGCAVSGRAKALISGDRALLELRTFRHVRIHSPAAFLDSLSK